MISTPDNMVSAEDLKAHEAELLAEFTRNGGSIEELIAASEASFKNQEITQEQERHMSIFQSAVAAVVPGAAYLTPAMMQSLVLKYNPRNMNRGQGVVNSLDAAQKKISGTGGLCTRMLESVREKISAWNPTKADRAYLATEQPRQSRSNIAELPSQPSQGKGSDKGRL